MIANGLCAPRPLRLLPINGQMAEPLSLIRQHTLTQLHSVFFDQALHAFVTVQTSPNKQPFVTQRENVLYELVRLFVFSVVKDAQQQYDVIRRENLVAGLLQKRIDISEVAWLESKRQLMRQIKVREHFSGDRNAIFVAVHAVNKTCAPFGQLS